jgi:hypothetical protein
MTILENSGSTEPSASCICAHSLVASHVLGCATHACPPSNVPTDRFLYAGSNQLTGTLQGVARMVNLQELVFLCWSLCSKSGIFRDEGVGLQLPKRRTMVLHTVPRCEYVLIVRVVHSAVHDACTSRTFETPQTGCTTIKSPAHCNPLPI